MNTPPLAGDELTRHVDALDRKIDTLSSQLQSLLEQAPQGPPAPISPIPMKTAPPPSDSSLHAPTLPFAPPTTTRTLLMNRTTNATMTTGLPESLNTAKSGSVPVETGSTDVMCAFPVLEEVSGEGGCS